MRNLIYSTSIFCFCLAMASCTGQKSANNEAAMASDSITVASLSVNDLNGEWDVVEVNGVAVGGENAPYMGFNTEEMRVYGFSGCNMMNGEILIDSTMIDAISFDKVASTRRACPNDTMEVVFLQVMNSVKSFQPVACADVKCDTTACKDSKDKAACEKSKANCDTTACAKKESCNKSACQVALANADKKVVIKLQKRPVQNQPAAPAK